VLCIVGVARTYKEAAPLATETANKVASVFEYIYKRGGLRWLHLIQVNPGKYFLVAASSRMKTKRQNPIRTYHNTT
jgi:hypothetical protein